jgi:glucose/arabinose dehydrogenase
VFAYYSAPLRASAPANFDHTNVLARFEVTADGGLDPESEVRLIELDWAAPNHDGGTLLFGPDRMLYFSMGDGGDAADIGTGHPPAGNGQDWTTLMGSILRIDPDGGEPYGIPDDNPFAHDHPGADEIWAYGLRNPYSFSIDRATGRMFAGDVGQELVEEIDLVERGRNYGWSVMEGPFCFDELSPLRPAARCNEVGLHGEPLVDPIAWYTQLDSAVADRSRIHGVSVIGGHVYRGSRIPALRGVYVFGDWTRRKDAAEGVLAVARETASGWTLEPLRVEGRSGAHLGMYVRGFGEDADGEIYVLTSTREGIGGRTGVVWRIVPTPVRAEA